MTRDEAQKKIKALPGVANDPGTIESIMRIVDDYADELIADARQWGFNDASDPGWQ
jgi:hypothetical protein